MQEAPLHLEIAEAPKGGTAQWIHANDGVRLRIGLWPGSSEPKGTLLIFPGRTEYIEKYGRTLADLADLGFYMLVIDWRGQGLSQRVAEDQKVGHVDVFSDYHRDVAAMVQTARELELPEPWHLIGHSLGACIGLRAISDGLLVSSCTFTGPMWRLNLPLLKRAAGWPASWAAQAIGKGEVLAPGTDSSSYVLSTPFEENRLTNDPDMYDYFIHQAQTLTDHQIGGPSMGWLFQTLKETRALTNIQTPSIPCLAFCGDQDQVVDVSAARDLVARWPNGRFKLIKNGKHDLFSEAFDVRSKVISRIFEHLIQGK